MNEFDAIQKIRAVLKNHTQRKLVDNNQIRIIGTGGTIDKVHDPVTEQLVFQKNSHLENMLREANIDDIKVETLMMIDSLNMTDDHRFQILKAVQNAPEDKIIITHGTSTMDKTALFLSQNLHGEKTVVITGALRPYSLMKSDSEFNLGGAVIAAKTLENGVYVVMSGNVFRPGEFKKDPATAKFDYL